MSEIFERKKEIEKRLNSLKRQSSENSWYREYSSRTKKLHDTLSDETKFWLTKREKYTKSKGVANWLPIILLIAGLLYCLYQKINLLTIFSINNPFISVLILIAIAIAIYFVLKLVISIPFSIAINNINKKEDIQKVNKQELEIYSECKRNYFNQAGDIKSEIDELQEELDEIEDFLYNQIYKNCFLFYGTWGGSYRYRIILDGHEYDEVRAKRLVVIQLSEGIHSVKIESTSYNVVDGSINIAYTFPTEQIIAGENGRVHAFTCDANKLYRVGKAELEKAMKEKIPLE